MQTIEVLVCKADGTQVTETREVPDDWFPGEPELEPTVNDLVNAMLGVTGNE